ncbi:unnamed protein product [Linum trigynum]|uniref:Gnk2-homologous domain-containing protein n=1 Tax=Linum trigynum TaxID=586398 RepID=A0AAV2G2P0_9ROSI
MAASRLLLSELSIFVLITAAAATTAHNYYDMASAQCREGNGPGDQLAVAVQIKKSLIYDLIEKLPYRSEPYYCNELTRDGLKMNGFAECPARDRNGDASRRACTDCLVLVGDVLIDGCGKTGAGYAHDLDSVCSFSVGYSLGVCPHGTY